MHRGWLLFVVVSLATAGCDDGGKIRVYEAPRNSGGQVTDLISQSQQNPEQTVTPIETPMVDAQGGSNHDALPEIGEDFQVGPISGKLPKTWRVAPTNQRMRIATLIAEQDGMTGDVAVTRFPGSVGSQLSNVNRWRQQLNLPPVSEVTGNYTIGFLYQGIPATMYAIAPDRPVAGSEVILVVSIPIPGVNDQIKETWFVKLQCPVEMVDWQVGEMTGFVQHLVLPGVEPMIEESGDTDSDTQGDTAEQTETERLPAEESDLAPESVYD